ncbi:MAG: hypothetical protein NTX76_01275 [Alphaproteobacteria bacterium]|nr:hypothetical protein [Alphaproteobacteria bacterium]
MLKKRFSFLALLASTAFAVTIATAASLDQVPFEKALKASLFTPIDPLVQNSAISMGPILKFVNRDTSDKTWNVSALIASKTGRALPRLLDMKGREVEKKLVTAFDDISVWRYLLKFPLLTEVSYRGAYTVISDTQTSYSVNIPALTENPKILYHACNGHMNQADYDVTGGIKDFWKNVVDKGDDAHIQFGGGDQGYFDAVFTMPSIADGFLKFKDDHEQLVTVPFTDTMRHEVTEYYKQRYMNHFNELYFKDYLASHPSLFMWDDHDIFNGWGSYSDAIHNSPVMQGIFKIAQRFFLLFQQHTTAEESSGLGYFGKSSYSFIKNLGKTAILAVDNRSERNKKETLSTESWDMAFKEAASLGADCKHLFVMLGLPVAFPKEGKIQKVIELFEPDQKSKVLNGILHVAKDRLGLSTPLGTTLFADDIGDGWNNQWHLAERNYVIQTLQRIAESRGLRVTFMSGDTHTPSAGFFRSSAKMHLIDDPRFMVQLTSAAVGNVPASAAGCYGLSFAAHLENSLIGQDTFGRMIPWSNATTGQHGSFIPQRNFMTVLTNPDDTILATLYAEQAGNKVSNPRDPAEYTIEIPPYLKKYTNIGGIYENLNRIEARFDTSQYNLRREVLDWVKTGFANLSSEAKADVLMWVKNEAKNLNSSELAALIEEFVHWEAGLLSKIFPCCSVS